MRAFGIIPFIHLLLCACSVAQTPQFDPSVAFAYLEKQCAFGPRNPGSEGHRACLDYLVAELKKSTDRVETQAFRKQIPGTTGWTRMANVIAKYGAEGAPIILCAHWDTRPWADHDPDPANRNTPITGANDGASGVAVLLEMARLFKAHPPPVPVEIILFDGEDAGLEGDYDSWCLGSQFYARSARVNRSARFAVLLDLVGDRDQAFPVEFYSQSYAPHIVDRVWGIAESLGIATFSRDPGPAVIDDHLSLLRAGIPAINIIDFDYAYWHTLADTPDKCSAESLGNVGRVLVRLIYSD